jgi:lipoprotein-releasing system ATP-binding protein
MDAPPLTATPGLQTNTSEPTRGPSQGARVEVRRLAKSVLHGGHRLDILRDVDFVMEPGEMVAVVGKSGAGKSTLLHILGTLDLPTAGQLLFDGQDVTRFSPAELAAFRNRSIGFVFQFHHLLPEFTALENAMMPALIQRVPRADARRRAEEILVRVGLGSRLTHRPGELSGGEQQRVALARALVQRPALLLADEPTGNLDGHTGDEIHELFFELNRERGTTMMIVTHNPELAARMPRRLTMVDGQVLKVDVPNERGTR